MKFMQYRKINYVIDKNNIIQSWVAIPFDASQPWIEVENPHNIHIGYDKIINNQLIQDNDKFDRDQQIKKQLIEKQNRVRDLESQLSNSDYKTLKFIDGALSEKEYAPIRQERQKMRDQINQLELEINVLIKQLDH